MPKTQSLPAQCFPEWHPAQYSDYKQSQETSVKVLDNYSHFIQIIRRLGSSNAELKAELATRPTPESQQALEGRIADLERRPTIESHQALKTKIADLQKRPTTESHQALQNKIDGLEATVSVMRLRRPARSHQDLQDEHQAVQDRLVELETRSTPQSRAILQDEIFDLDCYYTQGVLDLETKVATAEKQKLEARLHQSKVKYDELAYKTRTGLEKAASLRHSLETSHQATIEDLNEKLRISVAEFNKLADMARRGFQ